MTFRTWENLQEQEKRIGQELNLLTAVPLLFLKNTQAVAHLQQTPTVVRVTVHAADPCLGYLE